MFWVLEGSGSLYEINKRSLWTPPTYPPSSQSFRDMFIKIITYIALFIDLPFLSPQVSVFVLGFPLFRLNLCFLMGVTKQCELFWPGP